MPVTVSRYSRPPIFSEDSSAPRRRLAARGATEQLPGTCSRQSRALAGDLRRAPSCLPSAASAAHSNTARRPSGVVVPGCPDAHLALVALPTSSSASACPASARPASACPASARPASACPASARPASGVRASGVQSPVSAVGCPVSGASVRHPCVSSPCPLCAHRYGVQPTPPLPARPTPTPSTRLRLGQPTSRSRTRWGDTPTRPVPRRVAARTLGLTSENRSGPTGT
jgi:hypothetical protein